MLNLTSQYKSVDKLFVPFERLFSEILQDTPFAWRQYAPEPPSGLTQAAPSCFALAVESFVDKKGGSYHCNVSLPGVDPKDVNVQIEGDALTISGERKMDPQMAEAMVIQSEGWYGSFQRTIAVPKAVNLAEVKAEYRNGVLEITAPVDHSLSARKIQIRTAAEPKQINS
jgi:HSP20 family molecular chaperone IbpA